MPPPYAPAHPVLLSAHPELPPRRVYGFGAVLGLVAGLDFVAAVMTAFAAAHMQRAMGLPATGFLWVLSAYAAAAVLANLMQERLAARLGYTRFTMLSLGVFVVGSLLCATAAGLPWLVAGRFIQGLGGGGLFTAARVVAQLSSRREERLALFWGFGICSFGLTALAPWLSAVLMEAWGWQALFLLQAAIAVPLIGLVRHSYPRRGLHGTPTQLGRLDWPAVLGWGLGGLLVFHGLGALRVDAHPAMLAVAAQVGGGLLLVAYGVRRLHSHPDPWLDPRRLKGRVYLMGLAFYGLFYLLSSGWNYLLPAFLGKGLGLGLHNMGVLLSLGGLSTIGAMVVFHLNMRHMVGKRRYVALGYLSMAAACLWLALVAVPGAGLGTLLGPLLLNGISPVLALLCVAILTFRDVTEEDFAHAYQLKNILRELLTAVGAGIALLEYHRAAELPAGSGVLPVPGAEVLLGLALVCVVAAGLAVAQKTLR